MRHARRTAAACKAGAFLSAVVAGYSMTHHPWLIVPGLVAAAVLLVAAAETQRAGARRRDRYERTATASASDARLLGAEHLGNGANAEDCPACSASPTPPPYPFICPGPSTAADQRDQPPAH